jgi:hypothetical protein
MTVNDEWEKMWKDLEVAKFRLNAGTKENLERRGSEVVEALCYKP